MPVHHIFVDYENIHRFDFSGACKKNVKVTLVLGAKQKNVPVSLAVELTNRELDVRVVPTKKDGKNALDFVLSYLIGVECAISKESVIHVLSKDKGYDSLIQYLKEGKIRIYRYDSCEQIPILKNPGKLALAERVAQVKDRLRLKKSGRPSKRKTLHSDIHAHFGKQLSDAEVVSIIDVLERDKFVSIGDAEKLTYHEG